MHCRSAAFDFNPRSRVGNDATERKKRSSSTFQSTFPRGERRSRGGRREKTLKISIHVPAWGTTTNKSDRRYIVRFQSTFPRGERHKGSAFKDGEYRISIHVPAWGTTSFSPKAMLFHSDFNPRSRVGNDSVNFAKYITDTIFQSTFPRGERLRCTTTTVRVT